MEPKSLIVKILEQIRNSVDRTNSKLEELRVGTEQKLEELRVGTEQKFDLLTDRVNNLTDRVVEGEIRTATAITALSGTLESVKTLLVDRLDLRDRLVR